MKEIRNLVREAQYEENPERASFDELKALNDKLETPLKVEVVNEKSLEGDLAGTISKMLKEVKGDKGATGEKGDKGDKGDTGEQGKKGDTGEKGDTGATGLKGDKGLTGDKGDKGDKGDSGKDGIDGKDGQDAKIEEIVKEAVKKIQSLTGNDRIDISAIRNAEPIMAAISKLNKLNMSDQRWHGGGVSGIRDEGVSVGDVTVLDFIGAGVTVSYTAEGVAVVSIPGGGGANQANNETPAGAIDNNNTAFTLAHTPINSSLMLYLNGQLLTVTEDYTRVGVNLTLINAPMSGGVLRAFYQY